MFQEKFSRVFFISLPDCSIIPLFLLRIHLADNLCCAYALAVDCSYYAVNAGAGIRTIVGSSFFFAFLEVAGLYWMFSLMVRCTTVTVVGARCSPPLRPIIVG